jgi:hypothetical protein
MSWLKKDAPQSKHKISDVNTPSGITHSFSQHTKKRKGEDEVPEHYYNKLNHKEASWQEKNEMAITDTNNSIPDNWKPETYAKSMQLMASILKGRNEVSLPRKDIFTHD